MKIFEFSLFGLTIAPSYYGLFYAITFIYGIYFIKSLKKYSLKEIDSLFHYIFLGVLIGGRLGYVLFYNASYYFLNPFDMIRFWEGGMSFHGGLIGVIVASYFFSRKFQINKWELGDHLALIAPVGIFLGRMGNYLNKELLGFSYSGPLAVVTEAGSFFPSPLLEALLEGCLLFIILRYCNVKKKFHGQILAIFLIMYAIFRLIVELFIRTPDTQIGYYLGFITQGTLLTLPMLIGGIILYLLLSDKHVRK